MSRLRSVLVGFSALSLALAACAKIVGITDTEVTRDDSPDASVGALGGAASVPTDVANAGTGGGGSAGTASGGAGGTAGNAGGGGSPPVIDLDAGMTPDDGGDLGCPEATARCTPTGREVCGSGLWQPEPCPVNQPTCEADGQCIVRGPALVAVGNFFVDATEVTVGQYGLFLAAKGDDLSGQIDACSWNQSYWEGPVVMDPSEYPISEIDWCDANAYCAWAGKHLCGRIGGGPIAVGDLDDPNLNQFYVACGGPNGGSHPNDQAECNTSFGFSDTAPVATFPSCEGYFPGLFDMEGNVAEWLDACEGNAGATDLCHLMGGSTVDQTSYCYVVYGDETEPYQRDSKGFTFGFRCCAG